MRLVVFSHKPCWPSDLSPSGYATDGGFPMQMRALSELFDATVLVVPCARKSIEIGETALTGRNLRVVPLSVPRGHDLRRKLDIPFWLLRNASTMARELLQADAVHAPIPGDVGTIGMFLAMCARKPLFVRYCGNWLVQRTAAERSWQWLMDHTAGGRNVMMATGGSDESPSRRNAHLSWVFSTSLTETQLRSLATIRTLPVAGQIRLVTVGRQEQGKGTDLLIRSMPLIRARLPHVHLDVVGGGGGLSSLRESASDLGLTESVTFHGRVGHPQVLDILRQAHLFCFPTASEGFPKAVLEALACGLPVVTTPVSVLPQLIGAGCGHLIEDTSPEAVAAAVGRCLSDPDHYRALSASAIETAHHYSLERWRDTIGNALEAAWGQLRADA